MISASELAIFTYKGLYDTFTYRQSSMDLQNTKCYFYDCDVDFHHFYHLS